MNEASSLKARSLSSCEVATVQQASLRSSRADEAAVVLLSAFGPRRSALPTLIHT